MPGKLFFVRNQYTVSNTVSISMIMIAFANLKDRAAAAAERKHLGLNGACPRRRASGLLRGFVAHFHGGVFVYKYCNILIASPASQSTGPALITASQRTGPAPNSGPI